jgi:undecaprenyl diphosphate synthase
MPVYFITQSSLHVGIIMDGNGRWAMARGLPRVAGHRAGADAVDRVVSAAPGCGIGTLTLFAFSSDNWKRPEEETGALMRLFGWYLLEVIGRRDRLGQSLRAAIAEAEAATAANSRLRLRIAVDYSGRDAILAAVQGLADVSREQLESRLGPPVDLVIRTGGERRLSDFLLWECAYAELVFARRLWPDFDGADLAAAVRDFHGRERRFGAVPEPVSMRRGAWLD